MRRLSLLCGLMLCHCVVDETGYEDPPVLGNSDDFGVDSAGDAAEADATRLDDALVVITSERPLGAAPLPVQVIGLPGALTEGGEVTLSVDETGTTTATVNASAFVGVLDAIVGDTIEVHVDGELAASIEVLAPVEPPAGHEGLSTNTGGDDDDTWPTNSADPLAPVDSLDVGDGQIPGVAAPYIVFNETAGTSVFVSEGDADVAIAIDPGDRLCIAGVEADGALSRAVCTAY
jgi:hypothetical protein